MKNIVLFGTGDRGKKLYDMFCYYGIKIKYWIDSDERKWHTKLKDHMIYPPNKIREERDIYVCIAAMDMKKEMYAAVVESGVPKTRIFTLYETIIQCGYHHYAWRQIDEEKDMRSIVLDCSNGLVLGGVENWSIRLAKELKKQGEKVYLLSPYGEYEIEEEVEENVLRVASRPEYGGSRENLEAMLETMQRKLPCCFVISCINDMLLSACCLKKKYPEKVRVIAVIHQGLASLYKEYSEFDQYIEKYVAVSKEIQRGMSECGVNTNKVLHMTCPVDCIEPYERTYSLDRMKPVKVGYAGRLESHQKRMDALVLVLEELEKRHTNYHVQIAGTGSYRNRLKEEIAERGLENRVELCGKISRAEIADFWAGQDICINLSDFEGRSITIMEAMKNGAVPIVTATSGVKEDIEQGFSGYIVELGDYSGLAEKIDYLEKNRKLIAVYGNRAHIAMEQKSDMKIHMNFWNKILCGKE